MIFWEGLPHPSCQSLYTVQASRILTLTYVSFLQNRWNRTKLGSPESWWADWTVTVPRKAASPNVHLAGRWTQKGLLGWFFWMRIRPPVAPQLLRTTTTKLRLMALKKLHWIFFRVSENENYDSKPMKFQVVYSTTHFPSAIQLSEGNSELPQIRGGQNKHLSFLSFWVLEKAFLQCGPPPLFFRVGFVP